MVQLTRGIGRRNGSPHWSPDGRYLVIDGQGADGRWGVYRIAAEGGRPERLTDPAHDDAVPAFSRDGRHIYFASNRSGRFEIWRMPSEGGAPIQISTRGATVAVESWGGDTIYMRNAENPQRPLSPVVARSSQGGPEWKVLDGVTSRGFVPVQGGLYFLGSQEGSPGVALQFYDESTKKKLLTRIDARPVVGLTVSQERGKFLFAVQKPSTSDLMMIENFR